MFRDFFKYYKSRNPPPTLADVINIDDENNKHVIQVDAKNVSDPSALSVVDRWGLKAVLTWKIYKFTEIPGLILIRNPFTNTGQRYWITKCLKDYSRAPNKLNLDAHDFLKYQENWWDVCTREDERGKNLVSKLRWATLGYHHNWETKKYSEKNKSPIPDELKDLTKLIGKYLGFLNFNAEAAIINYYRMNSTLAGHVDDSEDDMDAPLFSLSFGQKAVFLIGGLSQEDPACPIFLQSGDVLVMSGQSRLRYHGVPRILVDENPSWDQVDPEESKIFVNQQDWIKAKSILTETRININVRQVLKIGQTCLNQ